VIEGPRVEPVARAATDELGRFQLPSPHAGLWVVRVEGRGFAPLMTELVPLLEPTELPDAELAEDTGLRVRVADARGAPIPQATVLIRSGRPRGPWSWRSPWAVPLRGGRTGQDGTLRLPRAAREEVSVSAYAQGHACGTARGVLGTAARLSLPAATALRLEVRSALGEPVAGVVVALGEPPHPVAATDASGSATVSANPARRQPFLLVAGDGRRLHATLAEGPLRYALPDRLSLRGRLLDADSRQPIPGALVWDGEQPIEAFVADDSGVFTLSGPPGRRGELVGGARGYLTSSPFPYQLDPTARGAPALALRPAAAIEGRVVDEGGAAIASAEVRLRDRPAPGPGMMRVEMGVPRPLPRSLTGPRGEFRLGPIDPEGTYVIAAHAKGYAPAERDVSDLAPRRTREGLDIVLTRGRLVTGTLVDPAGHPVRDGAVELVPGQLGEGPRFLRRTERGQGASLGLRAASDVDGRFRIEGVPEGMFDLHVRRSGFARRVVPSVELRQGEPGPADLGTILLQPGERVRGIVTDRQGRPIEGVEVFVRETRAPMMILGDAPGLAAEPDAVTDPAGWFAVEDLPAGEKCSLGFRRTGYVPGSAGPFRLPRPEPVETKLDFASKVSGVVTDTRGRPLPNAEVNLHRTRTAEMSQFVVKTLSRHTDTTDAEGRFLFEDQEPGRISLTSSARGYQQRTLDSLEVPEGKDLEGLELRLERGAVLEGRVLARDGQPAIAARVGRVAEEGDPLARVREAAMSDGNGHYRLDGLAPGEVSIEATHPDHGRAVKDIELEEGPNEVDLAFRGGVEVSGKVIDTAGNPIPEASVRLAPPGRPWGGPATRSERGGTFKLSGVQDGDYRLWVDAEGYAPSGGEQALSVSGEPIAGLEVVLDAGGTIFGEIRGVEPELLNEVTVRARGAREARPDFRGLYRLRNLPAGTYAVVATIGETGRQARGQATLEPGATEVRLDLEFGRGLTLSGRATQGRSPVAGAILHVRGVDVDCSGSAETDHEGAFSIQGLERGRYQVHLRDWRSGLAHDETLELATSREVVLEVPTAQVSGRVVDGADREGLAGVTLMLAAEEAEAGGRPASRSATTDGQGRFELTSIADGVWRLTATKPEYAATSRLITVRSQKASDHLEIEMTATEGLTLETRLPTGAVPSEVEVAVLDSAGATLLGGSYATGENGRVRLSTVPAGSFSLIVSAAGAGTAELQVQVPGPPVPVSLPPACGLRVRVPALATGSDVAVLRVEDSAGRPFRSLGWSGEPQTEWRMASGRVELSALPPGSWSVTVRASDGTTWQGRAVTSAGTMAELTLE
jgi:protocatechuate 3,4-dioxygenase beta subunit